MKKTKNKKKTGRSSETLFSSLKGAIWGVIISVAGCENTKVQVENLINMNAQFKELKLKIPAKTISR